MSTTQQTQPDTSTSGFTAGYPQAPTTIVRTKLRVRDDGTAIARFRGQIADATTDAWATIPGDGRMSLYAEVALDDTTLTEVTVAVVPTGKRAPLALNGVKALRLGSADNGRTVQHVYLLEIDGSADRAEHDRRFAERQQRRADEAAALAAAGGWGVPPVPGLPSGPVVDLDDLDTDGPQ